VDRVDISSDKTSSGCRGRIQEINGSYTENTLFLFRPGLFYVKDMDRGNSAEIGEEKEMRNFWDRMWGAAKFDIHVYEEVEKDRKATGQAMLVVILSSLAAGVGALSQGGTAGILGGIFAALVGWFLWAILTYLIGTRLLPEPQTTADAGQLLRTIGFSSAPGLIRVAGIIPVLAKISFMIAGAWMLGTMVVAVRQALDYKSTWRAIGVCLIGWAVQAVILVLVFALFGGAQKPA
jgi:hypothetical protein